MFFILAQGTRRLFHLRRLLSRIEVHPKEASIYKEALLPPSQLPRETLSRLGYLYSCSGNVLLRAKAKQMVLSLSSVHQWIPAEFAKHLGGRVKWRIGIEGSRPFYLWEVCGIKAAEIARVLGPYSWRKKCILNVLSEIAEKDRKQILRTREIQEALRTRKELMNRNFFEKPKVANWTDFAHLLDCRGSISFVQIHGTIRLYIAHPNYELMQSILTFLKSTEIPLKSTPKVYLVHPFRNKTTTFAFHMNGKRHCYFILREATINGLLIQKEKAMAILSNFELKAQKNAPPLSRYNHGRFKSLTTRELEISRLIISLTSQKKKKPEFPGWKDWIVKALQSTTQERKLSKQKTENQRIRREIKSLLKS